MKVVVGNGWAYGTATAKEIKEGKLKELVREATWYEQ